MGFRGKASIGRLRDEVPQKLKLFVYISMIFFCSGITKNFLEGGNPDSFRLPFPSGGSGGNNYIFLQNKLSKFGAV